MFSQMKSTRGNRVAQVFTNGLGYDHFYPLKSKGKADTTLKSLIHDVGIPQVLVSDNAPEEIHGHFHDTCQHYRIKQKQVVPHSPWQNLAEASIRKI